jgi:hypothetical protein
MTLGKKVLRSLRKTMEEESDSATDLDLLVKIILSLLSKLIEAYENEDNKKSCKGSLVPPLDLSKLEDRVVADEESGASCPSCCPSPGCTDSPKNYYDIGNFGPYNSNDCPDEEAVIYCYAQCVQQCLASSGGVRKRGNQYCEDHCKKAFPYSYDENYSPRAASPECVSYGTSFIDTC